MNQSPPKTKMTAQEVLAEVDWLLAGDLHPQHIAKQLGRTMASIEKLARANGRSDIAPPFGRVR